jgi:hypothetical protein
MTDPFTALRDMQEGVQKVDAVLVIPEDRLLFTDAGRDVVDSAGLLYAEETGHGGRLANTR